MRRTIIIMVALMALGSTSSKAQNVAYPVVFKHDAMGPLNDLGYWGSKGQKCYYYGDGGYELTVSKAVVAKFSKRGFTRRSLCMGLVSGIKFNPETGARLPTYMIDGWGPNGEPTDELPFDIPNCFRRALPFSDCKMNYGPMSGRKLSATATARYRALGQGLENFLKQRVGRFRPDDGSKTNGFIHGIQIFTDSPDNIHQFSRTFGANLVTATFFDYSTQLPAGYGYALNASGEAGPATSSESEALARDKRRAVSAKTLAALKAKLE